MRTEGKRERRRSENDRKKKQEEERRKRKGGFLWERLASNREKVRNKERDTERDDCDGLLEVGYCNKVLEEDLYTYRVFNKDLGQLGCFVLIKTFRTGLLQTKFATFIWPHIWFDWMTLECVTVAFWVLYAKKKICLQLWVHIVKLADNIWSSVGYALPKFA
ncbi:hypothetical protein RchiOBHm_Chr7g0223171 [Rosa chinensis]|uniref:Uncharacterized protein n=1 Tax=Rosa chinensis TaxID=74649 RepID=A0A2P6PDI0_ROSCH|nr:hypothetical protein RchiOBHm_Chr7g0223171 [Rosa chinensis]